MAALATDYMQIYCLGTLFTQLTLGLNAFITAQGNTFVSMYNVAIGAISNILLDAVFSLQRKKYSCKKMMDEHRS